MTQNKNAGRGLTEGKFLKIRDACDETGLSQYFLRQGCRSGSIPCIKSGSTYYIDMDSLYQQLRERMPESVIQ